MFDAADHAGRQRAVAAGGRMPTGLERVDNFGPNPGALNLLRFVPDDLGKGAPLVVMLHGCGQQADAFALQSGWIELAQQRGFVLLAPEQTSANNPNRCFNWFQRSDTERGSGEAASIARMIVYLVTDLGLDPDRIFVTGLSAGGAMAAAMLASYPEVFAAGAIIAGLPFGVADSLGQAMSAMHRPDKGQIDQLIERLVSAAPSVVDRPRLAIWHGDADAVVNVENARLIASVWAAAGGLESGSVSRVTPNRVTRGVWRMPGASAVHLELNLVAGLGHGVPLSTKGEGRLGQSAPFMLEAGVSSTLEIARFWGLVEGQQGVAAAPCATGVGAPPACDQSNGSLGHQVMEAVSRHVPETVSAVIAKALRSAKLLP